jgi:hypothetical protein
MDYITISQKKELPKSTDEICHYIFVNTLRSLMIFIQC